MRLKVGLMGVSLLSLLLLAGSAWGQGLRTASACRAHILRTAKQNKCLTCVANRGVFYKQDATRSGRCSLATPIPRPTPTASRVITSTAGCRARIQRAGKRSRCIACINSVGHFHKQGSGHGRCTGAVAPAPPTPLGSVPAQSLRTVAACRNAVMTPTVQNNCFSCIRRTGIFYRQSNTSGYCSVKRLLRSAHACRNQVANYKKRQRCLNCINRRGTFRRDGLGSCTAPRTRPRPTALPMKTHAACRSALFNGYTRDKCNACIRRAGFFYRTSATSGYCNRGAAQKTNPLYGQRLATHVACNKISRKGKRTRCHSCVNSRGIFYRQGGALGQCSNRLPANRFGGKISTQGACNRIGVQGKRRNCHRCVSRGGVFDTHSVGICTMPRVPAVVGWQMRTLADCNLRIGRRHKRRKCYNCVNRGRVFVKNGAAKGYCR